MVVVVTLVVEGGVVQWGRATSSPAPQPMAATSRTAAGRQGLSRFGLRRLLDTLPSVVTAGPNHAPCLLRPGL